MKCEGWAGTITRLADRLGNHAPAGPEGPPRHGPPVDRRAEADARPAEAGVRVSNFCGLPSSHYRCFGSALTLARPPLDVQPIRRMKKARARCSLQETLRMRPRPICSLSGYARERQRGRNQNIAVTHCFYATNTRRVLRSTAGRGPTAVPPPSPAPVGLGRLPSRAKYSA